MSRVGSLMKIAATCLVLCIPASAQTSMRVYGVSATQALLYYDAPDQSPCTIQVSESPSYLPLVADLDPLLFPGADSDAERNILPAGTSRLVPIGLRIA